MLTPRASTSSGNLSEQGAGDQGQQQQPQGQGEEEERGVFISLVASAYSPGYPDVGHAITAIALTTSQKGDNLLIRYVGESNVPSVQQIPWSKDFGTKIVGLSFDPSAQWLLAASADGTLCVLPAYFLCSKKVALTGSAATATAAMMTAAATAGSGTTLSTSKPHILRVKKPQGNVSACAWWKPSAKTSEYGVVGTTGGQVTFVDLITGEEVYSVKVRGAVTGLSIVDDRHDYKVRKKKMLPPNIIPTPTKKHNMYYMCVLIYFFPLTVPPHKHRQEREREAFPGAQHRGVQKPPCSRSPPEGERDHATRLCG